MNLLYFRTPIMVLVSSLGLLISCTSERPPSAASTEARTTASPTTAQAISTREENAIAMRKSVFNDYFEVAEKSAVLSLKNIFDEGLRQGFEKRDLAYAYEQHAMRMKLDYFNNETFEQFYPFNGAFKLEDHAGLCETIPFLTNKCGFLKEETGEVINFFCLNLNEEFFTYLAELGKNSNLIQGFSDRYTQLKAITPQDRQIMLLNSGEDLRFTSFDHQLFYFLFQACVNAEHQAAAKL